MLVRILSVGIITAILECSAMNCHAKESFSLIPYEKCKHSPRSPSKSMLQKSYRTYISVGYWHVFDINGDGWCDWIRNGRQGHRFDVDSVPMIEMIYLGTPAGWRTFEMKHSIDLRLVSLDSIDQIHLHGFAEAYGFYQPIPVYRKHYKKPLVVAVSRIDAPAPPPDIESINVFEWDDDTDNLRYVQGQLRNELLGFLKEKYCKSTQIPRYDGEELVVALGDLCK